MSYLSAAELAELTGYQPNQFERMRAWLESRHWPFEQPRKGTCPRVLRAYHDRRLSGELQAPPAASNAPLYTPNRAALEAFQHGRKKKTA